MQCPLRRPRDPGDPAAPRRAARSAAARRRQGPPARGHEVAPPGGPSPADDAQGVRGHRAGRGRLPGCAAPRRRDRGSACRTGRGCPRLPRRDDTRRRRRLSDRRGADPHDRRGRAGSRSGAPPGRGRPRIASRSTGSRGDATSAWTRRCSRRSSGQVVDRTLHARRDGRHLVGDRPVRADVAGRARGRSSAGRSGSHPGRGARRRSRRVRRSTSTGSPRSSGRPTTTSSRSSARSPSRSGRRAAISTSD